MGSIQNIISKSSKYTIFDASKEMAYLPLSAELRSKGKATVEIMGSKLGKSMGALTQSMIFLFFIVEWGKYFKQNMGTPLYKIIILRKILMFCKLFQFRSM